MCAAGAREADVEKMRVFKSTANIHRALLLYMHNQKVNAIGSTYLKASN